jgi:type IV pilus assembly protein PilW
MPKRFQLGLSLIELLVALLISAILVLAVFRVLAVSEGSKRTTTSVNDAGQSGTYALFFIDKWVRSAGSGFTQAGVEASNASSYGGQITAFGCQVFAAFNNANIIPRSTALPAPFGSVNTGIAGRFRLAPILIAPGQTTPSASGQVSDVLIVMAGSAGFAETPMLARSVFDASATPFASAASGATQMNLGTGVSLAANDLVLVADQASATNVAPCMVQQVASVSGGDVQLTNATGYGKTTIGTSPNTATITSFTNNAAVMKLGNVAAGNPPTFLLIGVGANNTLFTYDLLRTGGADATPNPNLQAVADGVFELHAVYGVDTDNNGTVDSWEDPGATGNAYQLSALMAGTKTAAALIAQIKAVRVGLILRTSLQEREPVAPASLTMFSDLGLTYTRDLVGIERNFRYRVVEQTIPLRNALMLE